MFTTGHNPPATFVAGQINDGASIGTFQLGTFAGVAGALAAISLRNYQGKLIGLVEIRKPDGTALPNENQSIKQREYFNNLNADPNYLKDKYPAFSSLIPLLATQAELASVGLTPDGQVPGSGSGKIAYQQNADGIVSAMVGGVPTTPSVPTPGVPGSNLLPTTPGTTPTNPSGTTTGTDGTTSKYPSWVKWVAIGVGVLALAYGGYVLMKKGKKKGK